MEQSIFQWLLANLSSNVSALLGDDDDDDNNKSSFGAKGADGPSSSLPPPVAGLTSTSLESMIPVNTLIVARPDCIGPRPLTVQVSVEAVDGHD